MANILKSKGVAWGALVLMILIICFTFTMRTEWWMFFDEFFAFMCVFCQLVGLYIAKFNPFACRRLQTFAAVFGILAILSLIGEFVVFQVIYKV